MKKIWKFAGLLFLVSIFFILISSNAQAHKPVDTSGPATKVNPIVITEHRVSWAAYNEFLTPGEVHFYRLEGVNRGEKIHLSLLVPYLERLKDFFPVIALMGSGLENDFAGLDQEAVLELLNPSPEEGVILKQFAGGEVGSFFEPFTQTRYYERQEMNIFAPASGDYYAAVFDLEGRADKYVFAIGEEEKWGARDILSMPRIWWDVRMFMEKETSTYITAGVVASSAILIAVWLLKR